MSLRHQKLMVQTAEQDLPFFLCRDYKPLSLPVLATKVRTVIREHCCHKKSLFTTEEHSEKKSKQPVQILTDVWSLLKFLGVEGFVCTAVKRLPQ